MLGINHIITNTCSIVLGAECLLLLRDTVDKINIAFFKNAYDNTIKFLTPQMNSGITFYIWIASAILIFYLGTLLPDCDSRNSILGKIIYIPVEHRTWTHTIWLPLFVFICSIWIPILFYFGLGYLLHLLWDSLSVCGICFFYPFSKYRYYGGNGAKVKKKHRLKLYRTGKISEGIIVGIMIALTIAMSVYMILY